MCQISQKTENLEITKNVILTYLWVKIPTKKTSVVKFALERKDRRGVPLRTF